MKLNLKITPKLTLVFVLFASVVLVGISLFAYYNGRSALEEAIISDLNSTATEKQAALETWVEEGKLDIDMIASYHHFQETISTLIASSPNSATARTAYEHLLTTMKKWVGKNRRFLDLFVLAPESGKVIAATDPHEEGRFKEDRLYFIKGKKGPYVQNPYYRISTLIPTMTAATPIISAEGRLLAVLAGSLNLNELNEIILRRTGLHQTDDAFLVNTSHLFITQPRFISDPAVLQRGIHTEAVNSGLAGKSGVLLDNDYRGIPSIIVYRWLPERQLCLITKIDLSEAFAPSQAFGKTIMLMGGVALLLASAIALGLARTVTRPILKIQTEVERFGKGEKALHLPETSRDEIGILAKEFNNMAANLAEKETKLRSYTEQLEQIVQERTEALRLSEERFQIAAESASDLIWDWDIVKGKLTWFGNIDVILGYDPGEFSRTIEAWEKIIHLDDHDRVMKALERHLEFRETYFEEYRVLRKDGAILFWTDVGTALWDDEGKPYKMVGSVTDITERKRAEVALRESEERYRTAIEHSNDGVAIDHGGQHLFVNQKFAEIFGYDKPEEIVGRPIYDIVHPDDLKRVEEIILMRQKGEVVPPRYEFRGIRKNGESIDLEVSATQTVYRGESVSLVYLRDITDRKQAEETLRRTEEQLRQSQKMEAIGQLTGGMAHDFNNLLTVIKGYSQLSFAEMEKDSPLKENIEEIRKATDRAADLIRQLLAFSRRQIMEMKVLDLNDLLRNLDKMLCRIIGEDIGLMMVLGENLGRVKTDPGQIEQVIMNLAVNARDAMPKGGKFTIETANVNLNKVYARSHVTVTPGPYVMISVADTGVGMTPEVRDRVFEPFFTTKEKGKGTGLGLSTVYGIVKQSGGNIWVYSEPGKGTEFKIYLPRVDEPLEELKEKVEKEGPPRGNERILIVEDEEDVLKLAGRILERQGYTVLQTSSTSKALEICKEQKKPIHLILTDVVMPKMSGRELIEQCRQMRADFKTLYMSGYTDDIITYHGILQKGLDYIPKPFTVDALARKVRRVLDK